eukprot:TRINITY_DN4579_c0_g1_i1.p1 TRINITY_DN4579_c0_g1~~TRINITY_DN4579_c0_g1_i1.p1  ORF type:complete len:179 (+),score=12.71 TRINITY_DN4579_c0_g1_i1:304-840(+)
MHLVVQALFSLSMLKRTTGVVRDHGKGASCAAPICVRHALLHANLHTDLAGRELSEHMSHDMGMNDARTIGNKQHVRTQAVRLRYLLRGTTGTAVDFGGSVFYTVDRHEGHALPRAILSVDLIGWDFTVGSRSTHMILLLRTAMCAIEASMNGHRHGDIIDAGSERLRVPEVRIQRCC